MMITPTISPTPIIMIGSIIEVTEVLVDRLLLEDHELADDGQGPLDNRRELTRN
jgi:hypothetical protein